MEPGNPFTALRRLTDTLIVSIMVAAFTMSAASAGLPPPNAAYSADSRLRVGDVELAGRVYHDRGLERRELVIDGIQQVVVRRPDLNHVYVVMPILGMGVETDLDAVPRPTPDRVLNGLHAEIVGRETIAGLAATKYRLTGTDPDGGQFDGYVWFTEDGIAVQLTGTVSAGGRTETVHMRLDNIRVGPQDPTLFERPGAVTFLPISPTIGHDAGAAADLGAAAE